MGDGPLPDTSAALLSLQQAASRGTEGKSMPVLACILPNGGRPVDVFVGLSPKGKGLNFDKTAPTFKSAGKPGVADKMFAAIQGMGDDFRKIAQNAGVMYSGASTNGAPIDSGLTSGGGSFAANIASRMSDGGNGIG